MVGIAAAIIAPGTSFASFFAIRPILARHSPVASLGEPGVLRGVLGGAAMITGAALVGLGLGALVRHSAGALAVVIVLFFVAPMIVELQPESWATVTKFLPHTASSSVLTVRPGANCARRGAAWRSSRRGSSSCWRWPGVPWPAAMCDDPRVAGD